MTIHRYATKRDSNERPIVKALRGVGAKVIRLSGSGVPDLAVYYHGEWTLMDCKGEHGRLTAAQRKLLESLPAGSIHIVHTPAEALDALCVELSANVG